MLKRVVCIATTLTADNECGGAKPVIEGFWMKESARFEYFNRVYSNRSDLGNFGGDSGYRFCGKGTIRS